jgi:hypothetical protein
MCFHSETNIKTLLDIFFKRCLQTRTATMRRYPAVPAYDMLHTTQCCFQRHLTVRWGSWSVIQHPFMKCVAKSRTTPVLVNAPASADILQNWAR